MSLEPNTFVAMRVLLRGAYNSFESVVEIPGAGYFHVPNESLTALPGEAVKPSIVAMKFSKEQDEVEG